MSEQSLRVISILMENEAGALARVVGLFAQRGYNIESLNVAVSDVPDLSRLTLSTNIADVGKVEQLCKQLNRLICVYRVQEVSGNRNFIARELLLIKVSAQGTMRRLELKNTIDIFGGKIFDVTDDSYIFQVVGRTPKIEAVLKALEGFNILEIDRSGVCGLTRGSGSFSMN